MSADLSVSWHYVVTLRRVRTRTYAYALSDFSSETIRPRDMLLLLKDSIAIWHENLLKACRSVCSPVC